MAWTAPTITEFKTYFSRDFNFATDHDEPENEEYVLDADVIKALTEAGINFNDSLYGSDAQVTAVFMYLVAFHLVVNLQNSAKGISSQSKFPISSNSVGGVAISFQIPERFSKDASLNQYMTNGYGMKYLSLALPFLVGNIGLIEGTTTWR
jgi:hypothetical protein